MQIVELHTLATSQMDDLLELMHELDTEINVTAEVLERPAKEGP